MRAWPLLVLVLGLAPGFKVKDPPPITEAWTGRFDRDSLGGDYYKSGPGYELSGGALSAKGAHNHPLWLRKRLPRDVRIEFDAWSSSPDGDMKIELFGDGHSYDPDAGAYM